jgi:hypothetical protein
MQSCASAAKAPRRRADSAQRHESHGFRGTPPPRTVIGDPSPWCGSSRNRQAIGDVYSIARVHRAGRMATPSGTTSSRAVATTRSAACGPVPGTIPATNQLERLNSTTAINVVSMSRAIRDRLRSFGLRCRGMGGLRRSVYIRADGYNLLAARPIESAQPRTCRA